LEAVQALLSDHEILTCNGHRFAGKLPGGPLHFLHKVYRGCSPKELGELIRLSAMSLPDDYVRFMSWADGATLYDNTLALFGIRDDNSRSVALEDAAAISLPARLHLLRQMGRWDQTRRWQPIGSLACATETFDIEISPSGHCRVADGHGAAREFPDFSECLLSLIGLLSNLSNANGLMDDSGFQVQQEIGALLRPQ
jgi:hypothetical protein